MGKRRSAILRAVPPTKLDFGCGPRKQAGFHGVDAMAFEGVDTVLNLTARDEAGAFLPWPWADGSIEEVFSSHFVEHLTNPERVHFFNELYRVMKLGAKGLIIVPHWSNSCAYGDPTHQWPPMTEWAAFYWSKAWRENNAPHTGYVCDFEAMWGFGVDERIASFNPERQQSMLNHAINAARDIHFTITKR